MHQIHKKPGKAGSIHEAESSLKIIRGYLKRDNILKSKSPLIDKMSFNSCLRPRFIEKNVTFKHSIIDMDKLASRLEEEGIGFKHEIFGIRIGDHIKINDNSMSIGVDAYPELMRIVSECLVEPKKLASLIKKAAA